MCVCVCVCVCRFPTYAVYVYMHSSLNVIVYGTDPASNIGDNHSKLVTRLMQISDV